MLFGSNEPTHMDELSLLTKEAKIQFGADQIGQCERAILVEKTTLSHGHKVKDKTICCWWKF